MPSDTSSSRAQPLRETSARAPRDRPDTVEVRRSPRRRRTVSAYRADGRVVVLIPASFTAAEERQWVTRMLRRVAAPAALRDEQLLGRARRLSARFLDGLA